MIEISLKRLLGSDIISVKPMSVPTGRIFYLTPQQSKHFLCQEIKEGYKILINGELIINKNYASV